MPAPTPELMLLSALVAAYLRRLPKKERMAFLEEVSDELHWQSTHAKVVRLRPRSKDGAVAEARTKAAIWWRGAVGIFIAHVR